MSATRVKGPPAHRTLTRVADAREIILAETRPLPPETVELRSALGRVLAEPVQAPHDVPPFDSSAMDGFAVRAADTGEATSLGPVRLALAGESRAGAPVSFQLRGREAVAISTGAEIPSGADAVVRLEDAVADRMVVEVSSPVEAGAWLRRAGEDLRRGETAVEAGAILGPAELGVLASVGRAAVACRRRPTMSVLTTGDELSDAGEGLGPGQIGDASAHSVTALARLTGASLASVARSSDDPGEIRTAIESALGAEVTVICGGVSVGWHDHVRPALSGLGVEERFWGVALRPGRPTWFGVGDHGLVFGLPGNPVSAMVTFILFVRPALLALAGVMGGPGRTAAILDEPYAKAPGRAHAVRCRMRLASDGWHVRPTKAQGSHVLSSMLGADCLAYLPEDAAALQAGDRVEIELLPGDPLGSQAWSSP